MRCPRYFSTPIGSVGMGEHHVRLACVMREGAPGPGDDGKGRRTPSAERRTSLRCAASMTMTPVTGGYIHLH